MKAIVFRHVSSDQKHTALRYGVQLISVPALSFETLPFGKLDATYDFIILSSAETLAHVKKFPRTAAWVVIGDETHKALLRQKTRKPVYVLDESHSKGVVHFFAKRQNPLGQKIFFPRSARAGGELPQELRRLGFRVCVRHAYGTRLSRLRKPLMHLLQNQKIEAFLITSPSIFQAIRMSFNRHEILNWDLRWIAIGPTTAKALRTFGLKPRVSPKPSVEAMVRIFQRERKSRP